MAEPKAGRFGVVNGHSTVRDWTINGPTNDVKKFRASNTAGGTGARKGALDWNGSFGAYGGVPVIMPGETFTFEGSTGDENSGSSSYSGPAICDQVALNFNWATQEIIAYTVNFSADGALTKGTAEYTDATNPDAPEACGTKVHLSLDGTVELPDVESLVLTITADNKPYVNSSSVVVDKCWTKRRPGDIDWTAAIVQQNSAGLSGEIEEGEDVILRAYIDTVPTWWELAWGKVQEATGLQVNRETGDIVKRTINVTMNAAKVGGGVGYINKPGAVLWWGVAPGP